MLERAEADAEEKKLLRSKVPAGRGHTGEGFGVRGGSGEAPLPQKRYELTQIKESKGCIEARPTSQTVYMGSVPINLSAISRLQKIDRAYLSRIFSGKQEPTLRVARKIAMALEMGPEDFLKAIGRL